MATARTSTFMSGNSEALRLPKDIAFGAGVDLTLVRSGDVLTVYPSRSSMKDLLANLESLPQPGQVEARDTEPLPEREGLKFWPSCWTRTWPSGSAMGILKYPQGLRA